ncbi:MAG: tyrosine-type recombinase/integrase [Clostridiales bacterium]|nr:tyrosine-type recombinase/integrase [Roseburia sp.]MDD7636588.1 tyrosine-type recombinase/integrase [Clostridiales bacterium]MDY4112791.1 tyrosine-type recombinase/integrase [Roseburia sp.]
MARRKKGELPSGSIRRQIYDHSELVFDEFGKPIIDPKTGKQKKKRVYISVTADTRQEADLAKAELRAGKKKHQKPCSLTLYEAIDDYISSSDAILSPSTIRGYRTIQRNAFSSIMHMPISDLSNTVLRDAVNAECKRTTGKKNPKPISSKTVINEYGLLSSVLNMYAPDIDRSVKLPQKEHNKHEISTPDVIYDIVKGTDIELPVMLAMWLSFTESEILGLTKSKSISSDGRYITIKEVLVKDADGNTVVKNKGKQPARDRTLRIPEYIKGLIDQVNTDQLVTISGTALSKRFNRIIKKAEIPHMTFHDLRHVNASVMSLLKVPDKYAQERGGWHSDHIMKSVYQQTFSSERAAVDEQIDNYFNEILITDKDEKRKQEKYQCWLTLFDRNDNKKNQALFLKFCKENEIEL